MCLDLAVLEDHADSRASAETSSFCSRSQSALCFITAAVSSAALCSGTEQPSPHSRCRGRGDRGPGQKEGMRASLGRGEGRRPLLLVPPEPGRSKGTFHPGSLCPASSCSEQFPGFWQLCWDPGHLRETRAQFTISLPPSLALAPLPHHSLPRSGIPFYIQRILRRSPSLMETAIKACGVTRDRRKLLGCWTAEALEEATRRADKLSRVEAGGPAPRAPVS